MTQQIIDVGANANDGTGEPLREAFTAVNDNFTQIWTAGPVGSQVQITGNIIRYYSQIFSSDSIHFDIFTFFMNLVIH